MSLNKQSLTNAYVFLTRTKRKGSLNFRQHTLRWRLLSLLGTILLFTLLMIGLGVSGFVAQTEQVAWEGRQGEAVRNATITVVAFVQRVSSTLTAISLLGRNELQNEPALLLRLLKDNPALLEVIFLDRDGHLLAHVHQDAAVLAELFTIPQSNWFQHARNGEQYIGDLQLSPNNEPYLIMAIPAPDGGVVAARLQMKVLGETVAAIKFGKTGQAYVVNQAGQVIAHTNPQIALANINLDTRPELAAMLHTSGNLWTGAYVNFEGTPVFSATAPVPSTNWVVVTELAQTEAFSVTRRAWWLLGISMLVFGILSLSITTKLLGRVIFQPMEELQAGAKRIGQGDLVHRIAFIHQDEVGQVAHAFNEMAEQLHNREEQLVAQTIELATEVAERKKAEEALRAAHDELEIRVQKRTAELAEANTILRVEISERTRAEAALRESEALYKTLFTAVPVSIFTKDQLGRYTSVNSYERGYWHKDPVGYTDSELFAPEIANKLRAADLQVFTTGKPLVIEEQFQAQQGLRIMLSHKVPLYDANHLVIGILGASLDITERKQTEEALAKRAAELEEATNFLDSIIENLPNMLFVKQAKSLKFVQFNRAWEELLGLERQSMLGKSDYDFLPKEQADAFTATDLEVLTKGISVEVPVELIQTAHRGLRMLHTRKIPVFGVDGQPKYLLGFSEDITERKRAEDQIRQSLEEKVVLLQEIHHRVKNNLQVISSLLYLQAGKIQDPQMLSILRDSQNRVKSMALIHEKLYQTKDMAKVDLGEYIQNLASYLFRSYTAHAGAIQLHVQADNVFLSIDTAVPCGLIINELISNALKHAFPDNAAGEIQIELHMDSTLNAQGAPEQLFTLVVRDNGVGFPDTVDFQNTASLGLQLVNTLVNQLDGVISLQYNNGTEFKIQFPNPQ
ncbi:hypothetical protein BH10CHL1_BH10CHL1_18600 [soil metagenome]